MKILYDSADFPISSRKAIAGGETFAFEIRDQAWQLLRPHVVESAIPDWAWMSAIPELRSLTLVIALAGALGAPVRVMAHDDYAVVTVGKCH